MNNSDSRSRVLTLVFTDLADSTALKSERGDVAGGELIARHRDVVTRLAAECSGRIIDWAGDGCFLTFETPSTGVDFGLRLQRVHFDEPDLPGVRVGVHMGEVTDQPGPDGGRRVEGLAVDLAARIQSLAVPGQVLMSSAVFNSARQRLRGDGEGRPIEWRAHGLYEFKGVDDAVEVCEAGFKGLSPLTAPAGSEKAHRAVSPGEEDTLGWRPAVGLHVPGRPNWALQEQLGEGGFGEVWLAAHEKTHATRVFKFCFEPERVRGLKREVVLFRLLKESLGHREDIAQILDWEFDSPPFFIESEYTEGGDLKDWAARKGGIGKVPLETRLELVAQAAVALGAAHSVGVLHKDIKPANILVSEVSGRDTPRASLTDFGIGLITDPGALAAQGITAAGMTDTLVGGSSSSGSGTRLYMAPEVVEGKAPTTLSDIYALGVVLYQVVIGDLSHSIAPGWERDVDDDFLRDDIAHCVDGAPEHRLGSANELAERLRSLEERRADRAREIRERKEAEQAKIIAQNARKRRRQFMTISAIGILVTAAFGVAAVRENQRATTQARLRAELAESNTQLGEALDEAERAREEAMYREYVSTVQLAGARLDQDQPLVARNALLNTPPQYRGWEWGYLVNRAWPDAGAGDNAAPKPRGDSDAETWTDAAARLVYELPSAAGLVSRGAFNPNERVIVTANFSGTARIWSADTGDLLNEIGEPGSFPMYNVEITGAPPRIITTSDEAVLWDGASGARIATLSSNRTDITSMMALSPDESLVAVSYSDRTVGVWNTESGDLVARIGSSGEQVSSLRFHATDAVLGVGYASGTIGFYELPSGKRIRSSAGPAKGIVVVGPHHERAASLTGDHELFLWDIASGDVTGRLSGIAWGRLSSGNVAFSPDGSVAVCFGNSPTIIRIADSRTGREIAEIRADSGQADGFRFSPDGASLVAGGTDGVARVWRAYTATESGRRITFGDFDDIVYSLDVSPDGSRVAAASYDGTAGVWDIATGRKLVSIEGRTDPLGTIKFVDDGTRLYIRSMYEDTTLWDAATGELIAEVGPAFDEAKASIESQGGLRGGPVMATSAIRRSAVSPDGRRVFRRTQDGVALVDTTTGRMLREIHLGAGAIATAFHPELNQCAISVSGRGAVFVFDLDTGKRVATFDQLRGQVLDLEYNRTGDRLLAAVMDGTARIFDIAQQEEVLSLTGHDGFLFSATYSPDGETILTASGDNTAKLWDAESGEALATFPGQGPFVMDASFSPDGERVMTLSPDRTIKVWDRAGHELATLDGNNALTDAAWTPDGSRIVSAWADGKIRVFDSVSWAELAALGDDETSFEERLAIWRQRPPS